MSGQTHPVSLESFESVVDSNEIVFLDFWAAWCKPCRIFSPVYDALAEKYPQIYFGKVNTEEAVDLAQAFHVRSVPTIMAFKKGELVYENSGLLPLAALEELITKLQS